MAKWNVDPPLGWKFGFPKVWDTEKDPDLLLWLGKEGYSPRLIKEFGKDMPYRMWGVENDNANDTRVDGKT